MPFSGGTAGAHDDAMHQGSAKRHISGGVCGLTGTGHALVSTSAPMTIPDMKDVANGIAALDAGGHVLAPGYRFTAARGAAEQITIRERTSDERVFRWIRIGADDYEARVTVGGVEKVVQHAGLKDVADGIAGLDAAGALLVPGSKIYYTRDGLDDVHIYERTSNEEAYAFHRVGADDYTFHVKELNVWKRMQTESMKNIANGVAGLDANILLSPALLPPCMEEYSNHLGAVDNFTQTGVAGNGVANTVVASHYMNLSTGLAINGHALFESKSDFTLSSKPIVLNFKIQNIINGAGGTRVTYFGLMADFTVLGVVNGVYFAHSTGDVWSCYTESAGLVTYADIASVSNEDLCTIVATSSKLAFFVNGTLVFTATTNIPTVAMEFGAVVHEYGAGAGTAREIAIDLMSIKRYV